MKKFVIFSGLVLFVFLALICKNNQIEKNPKKTSTAPKTSQVKLKKVYPYDPGLFTQGLELVDEEIVVGTGKYGESVIGKLSLETGKLFDVMPLNEQYFGEGLTYDGKKIWQLTWKEGVVLVRDPETFALEDRHYYEGEGWGLCYDGKNFIMSDGSDTLTYRNGQDFSSIQTVKVKKDNKPVEKLNELEYYQGFVYANVWYSGDILKIDPKSGTVKKVYDTSQLLKDAKITDTEAKNFDVLNGIAHVKGKTFLLAGKNWSRIFEVRLD